MKKFDKHFIFASLVIIALIILLIISYSTSKSTNISDWKTYQNNKYGFESKYPDSYSEFHKSGDSDIDFRTAKECELLLNTATNVFPPDCQIYTVIVIDAQKNTPSERGFGIATSSIVVAGIQGEKVTSPTGLGNYENMDQILVWFQKGDKLYIQTFTFNHAKSKIMEGIINQTLASFKFINK